MKTSAALDTHLRGWRVVVGLAVGLAWLALPQRASAGINAIVFDGGLLRSTAVTPVQRDTFRFFAYLGMGVEVAVVGPLLVGVRAQVDNDPIFGRNEGFGLGTLGVNVAGLHSLLGISVEGGVHVLGNIGGSLTQGVDTPIVVLPTMGGRLQLGILSETRSSIAVGLSVFALFDIGKASMTSVGNDQCFITCDHQGQDFVVGGRTVGLALNFDIGKKA